MASTIQECTNWKLINRISFWLQSNNIIKARLQYLRHLQHSWLCRERKINVLYMLWNYNTDAAKGLRFSKIRKYTYIVRYQIIWATLVVGQLYWIYGWYSFPFFKASITLSVRSFWIFTGHTEKVGSHSWIWEKVLTYLWQWPFIHLSILSVQKKNCLASLRLLFLGGIHNLV